jgi:hypothetical protein
MMLLAMPSPLLGIGFVMALQVFEIWALGPSRPEGHSRQPHRSADAPSASRQSLPADRSHRPDALGFGPGGASDRHQPLLRARASLCEAKGDVASGQRFTMPLQRMANRSIFRLGLVETPVDLPRTIHG